MHCLNVLDDATAAANACAVRIGDLLGEALATRPVATLAVSGGHTPKLMFHRLAVLPVDWSRTHLFWVDERCVPPEDSASNYKLARDSLIAPARIPEANVHRVYGEIPPADASTRYVDEIRGFFGLEPGKMPVFDVVQCGMGPDAHTASLFPGEPLIDDHEHIAAPVFAPQFNQWRVTLLPGPLQAARSAIYLVSGADKAPARRAVLDGPQDPKKYPTQIIGRQAEWFIDRPAAQ